ncbi:cysteine desulfurase [Flavonifractor sp. An82]|uniref:aminotransferase class V-fold PLP-dependent enzyme n=1 Tax=Flavonifractor sp. An82 TaxID=1965660 RepID=UPI000B39FC22|nr:aminotransferase class V-fold PLP-dependent enzyme [Flavonifractor sp. An82]OUN22241.1 cysteine desulfurase [Flavonifractor sp. An82]
MAYFDNAATTYPKPEVVYSYMDMFYRSNGASAGRGKYGASVSAGALIAETRQLIQDLMHCQAKQVVFTPTATVALNIVLQGLIRSGVKEIYISPFEHNAVTRTLHSYSESGQINVHKLAVTDDMVYDIQRIRYQFESEKPDLVIISHASNVFGLIAPIEDIFKLSKQFNAYTVADMAQTAGLVDCNVGSSVFDFAIFAGHKTLYGPTGISGFIMKPEIDLPSVIYGGTGYESANQNMPRSLPERFEMGTMNISGIAGLNAALKWIDEISISNLREKETRNRLRLLEILDNYWFIKVIGNYPQNNYVGIVSCVIDGISSDSAGQIFDKAGIAVRTGLQCAPLAHEFMKTYPAGTIRFSVSYFTTEQDFQELIQALGYIEENL